MDHNLTDQAAEQAALREAQEQACAECLYRHFDWTKRMAEVEEIASIDFKALCAAHTRFMQGYGIDLQLLFNKLAMELCEAEAKRLVSVHGGDWVLFLGEVE